MKNLRHLLLLFAFAPALLFGDSRALPRYGSVALSFEPNVGQSTSEVKYLAHGFGYTLFLTAHDAIVVQQDCEPLRIHFMGGADHPRIEELRTLDGVSHYLIGNDPSAWRTNIANVAAIRYHDVYPGIDVDFYGNRRQLEFDFVVNAGVDPRTIRLAIDRKHGLRLDAAGNVVLPFSELRLLRPDAYQEIDGTRTSIQASYVIDRSNHIGFRVGSYDTTKPLIIDPVLSYSTYLGGAGFDQAYDIAVDSSGNAYITGQTGASAFPVTPGTLPGSIYSGYTDAFVTKLNPQGTAAVYSTYLGGYGPDTSYGIAVDASGNAYATGEAGSYDFPVTPGAFQSAMRGGFDVFVAKLNAQGSALIYSTLIGGSFDDFGRDIVLDASGNAYLTGWTKCAAPTCDFPVQNAFQPQYGGGNNDAFVTKLNSNGSALIYSTYLGGGTELNATDDWGSGIAVDSDGNAYVTGYTNSPDFPVTPGAYDTSRGSFDAFVTKFSPDGRSLIYSTLLGGMRRDLGLAIAVDGGGHAFVAGQAESPDFPVTPGAFQTTGSFDAFVTKFNPQGSALVYSTYLGGSGDDRGWNIALDGAGNAHVTGDTTSLNFPTASPIQASYGGGLSDAFASKLNASGSALIYSTFLGGNLTDQGKGMAIDSTGAAYVAGFTSAFNFPNTAGAFQPENAGGLNNHDDAFVAKIIDSGSVPPPPPPPPEPSGTPAGPGNLTALAVGSRAIELRWTDNSSNESGFRIERCQGSGCTDFAQVGTASVNTTTYLDSNLNHRKTYRYRIAAFNSQGSSGYSNIVAARPLK